MICHYRPWTPAFCSWHDSKFSYLPVAILAVSTSALHFRNQLAPGKAWIEDIRVACVVVAVNQARQIAPIGGGLFERGDGALFLRSIAGCAERRQRDAAAEFSPQNSGESTPTTRCRP